MALRLCFFSCAGVPLGGRPSGKAPVSRSHCLCGLISPGTRTQNSPPCRDHPRSGQYLPTKQTLVHPPPPSLSPADTPIAVFLWLGAARVGPIAHAPLQQLGVKEREREGSYLSGPWWPVRGLRRRPGSSGAPGARARKCLQRKREDTYMFIRSSVCCY